MREEHVRQLFPTRGCPGGPICPLRSRRDEKGICKQLFPSRFSRVHAWGPQLLSPRSATTAAHDRRSRCEEKAVHRNQSARPAHRSQSKARAAARTQHSPTQEKSLCKNSRSPLRVVPPHPVA
ncbi:unnamed protein product [Rangifer tarandus platyrhynchus]|uniref:Uncharacterized protein n=2 Tax=Rangifer tarandus platyrhynchus TaxID=3082113 RepID=A0ABN8XM22_RANTA|nr:unnamed protein product [Rangifer tarandus platyrhynchus]